MKLEFSVLVIDDTPDSIEQATRRLGEYLESKGFALRLHIPRDFSRQSLRDLARAQGRDYDLVIVDYNLGQADTDGATVARQLRQTLQFTDMVFYSSDRQLDLHSQLAKHAVSGVFIARRDDLDDALVGLTDTVIGKAVDLNHMRGIAMAEVAEMDVLMQDTLQRVFLNAGDRCVDLASNRTMDKLRENAQEDSDRLESRFSEGGLSCVVGEGRLFSSAQKYRAVRRMAKCLPKKPAQALAVLKDYDADIIGNRNMLAHVKEETTPAGQTSLRSISGTGETVTIDDNWMAGFRLKLRAHKNALALVCAALQKHCGTAETAHNSEERGP